MKYIEQRIEALEKQDSDRISRLEKLVSVLYSRPWPDIHRAIRCRDFLVYTRADRANAFYFAGDFVSLLKHQRRLRRGRVMENYMTVSDEIGFQLIQELGRDHNSYSEFLYFWKDNEHLEPVGPFKSEALALHDHLLTQILALG